MHLLKYVLFAALIVSANTVQAGEVQIIKAAATSDGTYWKFDVTLKHFDTGWEHYADAWRIISNDGKVLGTRTLMHPHVDEQPFTRSLPRVKIPETESVVFIEAHDNVHGWAPNRYELKLK